MNILREGDVVDFCFHGSCRMEIKDAKIIRVPTVGEPWVFQDTVGNTHFSYEKCTIVKISDN